MSNTHAIHAQHENHHNPHDTTVLGFWVYLLTDMIIFGTLFAVYAVLRAGSFDGITTEEMFLGSKNAVLFETIVLLTSSFTFGIAMVYAKKEDLQKVYLWLAVTFILGLAFLFSEVRGFMHHIHEGFGWTRSGMLSAYYALVGTHGLHVLFGLFWMIVIFVHLAKNGLSLRNKTRITLLSFFWHFLDIIWIFVFSIVYLMGGV